MTQPTFFEGLRSTLPEALEQTRDALRAYAVSHPHWAIAYSGGKDSSATVTVVAHLIETGQVPAPASLTVLTASGLIAGITPTSTRRRFGQGTLGFVSSSQAGSAADEPKAGC